jgi:hypothetical protein
LLVSFKFFVVLSSYSLPRNAANRSTESENSFVYPNVLTWGRNRLMHPDIVFDVVYVLALREVEECRPRLRLCIVDCVLSWPHLLFFGLPALRLE